MTLTIFLIQICSYFSEGYLCNIQGNIIKKNKIHNLLTFFLSKKHVQETNERKISDIFEKNRKCLELSLDSLYALPWRGGRVVEGAPLLRE